MIALLWTLSVAVLSLSFSLLLLLSLGVLLSTMCSHRQAVGPCWEGSGVERRTCPRRRRSSWDTRGGRGRRARPGCVGPPSGCTGSGRDTGGSAQLWPPLSDHHAAHVFRKNPRDITKLAGRNKMAGKDKMARKQNGGKKQNGGAKQNWREETKWRG